MLNCEVEIKTFQKYRYKKLLETGTKMFYTVPVQDKKTTPEISSLAAFMKFKERASDHWATKSSR